MVTSSSKHDKFGYEQVADAVRGRITSGEWQAGDRLPNADELATLFGFSRMTVLKGLQQLEAQGIVTMGRGRGTFVRRQLARPAVGFITRHLLDAPYNGFATQVAGALERCLHARGWTMRLYADAPAETDGAAPWELQEALERGGLAGLVSVNSNIPRGYLRTDDWQRVAVPHVDLSRYRSPRHRLCLDHDRSMELLRQVCVDMGISSIGSLQLSDDFPMQTLADVGVTCLPGWQAGPTPGIDLEEAGYMVIRQLWNRPNRPDALFVADDVIAKGVAHGLVSVGARVPEDILLIARIPSTCRAFYPLPIIRIVVDVEGIATQILDLLDQLTEDPELDPTIQMMKPYLDVPVGLKSPRG